MKRNNIKGLFVTLTIIAAFSIGATEIYDVQQQSFLSLEEGISLMPERGIIILGESHYQEDIQKSQGDFINKYILDKGLQGDFSLAWEFLEFPNQTVIESSFEKWVNGLMSFDDFMIAGIGNSKHGVYRPMFEATKNHRGDIVATNAPRAWKRKIVSGGFSALGTSEIPRGLMRGSDEYFDRFIEAMGGHGDAQQFEGYFLAQSYTDAVMADQIERGHKNAVTFMVVGHFHSDYGHGLPAYLVKLTSEEIVNVRILDAKGMTVQQLNDELASHHKYGEKADYFLVLNR